MGVGECGDVRDVDVIMRAYNSIQENTLSYWHNNKLMIKDIRYDSTEGHNFTKKPTRASKWNRFTLKMVFCIKQDVEMDVLPFRTSIFVGFSQFTEEKN